MPDLHKRVFAALVLLWLANAAMPANAAFGNCNDSQYLAKFDERLADEPGFLCVETPRVPVTSDAGTTHIRIVQHLNSDWATRPGAMRAFKDGVDASARAMTSLGSFRISDVTILLIDGFAAPVSSGSESFGSIAAWTNFAPGDECRITIWLLGSGATASYGASVVAHELFHCVQRSSLSSAQMAAAGGLGSSGGGTWWQEGSADWFSTVASAAPRYMADRVSSFDSNSPNTALNRMTYDAYVFFAWLGRARGRESLMPFLRGMASNYSEAAQHRAMVAALPADQWLRFAEDYLDRKIRDGQGASIGSTPQTGNTHEWTNTRTQRIELSPFVLKRANLTFQCGRWAINPQPRRFHAAKPGDGDAWAAIPTGLNAMDGRAREFRFAGINASSAVVNLQIAGTLEAGCQQCAGVREIDRCMLGTWEMTVDGMQQWARENLPNFQVTGTSLVGSTLTLNEDGTFSTGAARVSVTGRTTLPGSSRSATAQIAGQASGRWSAASGRFNMCPDTSAQAGSVTTVVEGRTITVPMNLGPMEPQRSPYVCSASSLRVSIPMAGAGTVNSTYRKVAGPR